MAEVATAAVSALAGVIGFGIARLVKAIGWGSVAAFSFILGQPRSGDWSPGGSAPSDLRVTRLSRSGAP